MKTLYFKITNKYLFIIFICFVFFTKIFTFPIKKSIVKKMELSLISNRNKELNIDKQKSAVNVLNELNNILIITNNSSILIGN